MCYILISVRQDLPLPTK